jgi:hypothetical protein
MRNKYYIVNVSPWGKVISPSDWNKFKRIRNYVTNLVRKSKEEHKNNLIKKLINENSSGSNWWKTVKQLTGIKSRDHGIPPISN